MKANRSLISILMKNSIATFTTQAARALWVEMVRRGWKPDPDKAPILTEHCPGYNVWIEFKPVRGGMQVSRYVVSLDLHLEEVAHA